MVITIIQVSSCLWQIAAPEPCRSSAHEVFCTFSRPCALTHFGSSGHLLFFTRDNPFADRDTLGLKVTEAPDFKSEPQIEAIPVFADDNITVYSIPIVPTPHGSCNLPVAAETPILNASLKRMREPSPDLPSKRPSLHPSSLATDDSTAPLSDSPLLNRFMDDPQFDPTSLTGDEADAWRRLIIEYMFTWTEPLPKHRPPSMPRGRKGKRGKDIKSTEASNAPLLSAEAIFASLPQTPFLVGNTVNKPLRRGPKGKSPAGSMKPLPAFTASMQDASMAYIVVGPRVRGKFDVKRAAELGLYGPLRGNVARGESVTFTVDDGAGGTLQRTVNPEDCVGEHETTKVRPLSLLHSNVLSKCVKVVMIFDVPAPDHIESLISAFAAPAYSNFRVKHPDSRKDYAVHAIYHLLGSGVLEDERYKSFMGGFSDDTQHIICSPDHNPDPLTFTSAGLSQLRLNQLDPDMFPLPHYSTNPRKDLSCTSRLPQRLILLTPFVTSVVTRLPPRCSSMQPNSYVDVRPPRPVAIDPVLREKDKFHPTIAAETPPGLSPVAKEKFRNAQDAVATRLIELDGNVPRAGDELVVIPLGTSSAVASRYRNGDYLVRFSFPWLLITG